LDPAAAADTTFSQLDYVQEALQDAERLLQFASETGFAVDDGTKKGVLDARAAFARGLDELTTANLLTALAKLATMASPVTPESLRVRPQDIQKRHPYRNSAVVLAVIIIVYSTLSFVISSIAASIRADITTANDLAVKLNSEFPTPATASQSDSKSRSGGDSGQTQMTTTTLGESPTDLPGGLLRPDVVKNFQQYAASIRNIDGQARSLNFFMHPYDYIFHPERIDPYYSIRNSPDKLNQQFELPLPLTNYAQAAVDRTKTYQRVRYFAQDLADDVSLYYGAVSMCILPVLYALLGTFAYLLRTYERRVSTRSYVRSATDSARFVTAAIGGAVVGLFSNFTLGQGNKVSPLAIAFLVGYAVDVFYAFLETLIQSFSKTALTSNLSVRTPTLAPDSAKSSTVTPT
jgi:hypothetical protein